MLHAGLDLSRRRLDVCLVDDAGEVVARTAAAPDADGLRHLAMRVGAGRVRAVIESMNGARSVHQISGPDVSTGLLLVGAAMLLAWLAGVAGANPE
jgi:hypothetical protein